MMATEEATTTTSLNVDNLENEKNSPTSPPSYIETQDEEKERENFQRIKNAFRFYRSYSLRRVEKSEKCYHELSAHYKELIPNYLDHLDLIRTCIDHNQHVINQILGQTEGMFENRDHGTHKNVEPKLLPTSSDMDKVRTTLKQFSRDWSEAGKRERTECYQPVIKEICDRLLAKDRDPSSVYVLVPGAGLGRLSYELAKCGFSCQGNEWSLFMLFASNFVLNKCREVNSFKLYPWVYNWINLKSSSHQIEAVTFPDISPADLPEDSDFSMAAGDFLEVYTEPECWDCVATVFFLDTAHNVIAYIETIWNILKPGGYWVNLGPLLYHFADLPSESSIELSYDEIRSIILKFGFQFEKEEVDVKSTYTQNVHSMLTYQYNSVFFVVRKPL